MGFFKGKEPKATKPRVLHPGNSGGLVVDMSPELIEWARANKPLEKWGARSGYLVQVRLDLIGQDVEIRSGNGGACGKMNRELLNSGYLHEFQTLQARGEFGLANIFIPKATSKNPNDVLLCLNYWDGSRYGDGGILTKH